ncbi:hypothetical protein DM860_005223 [Cuscuta australis]|uniref:Transposase MuDR plant domain-containing protein n=1 Tax=Cuscuta australis TaxID=267555 RepID=A0A328DYW1_9ASTE|nr:hypothetical protein DM860_005223 [Cuscuta australis]
MLHLKRVICKERFRVSYAVGSILPPVNIDDESSFQFYMQLKCIECDFTKLSLCIEFDTNNTSSQGVIMSQFNEFDTIIDASSSTFPVPSVGTSQSLLLTQFTQPLSLSSEDVCIAESIDSVSVESTPNVVISHYHPTTIRMDCIYKSKMDLQHHLQMFSIVNNFQFRTVTSTKTSYHVVCVDSNCKWALRAVRVCGASLFQIRRFDSEHSCPVDFREGNHRQETSTLLAGLVAHRYADASKKPYQPIDLMDDMRREYGITISYKKALVVKRKAMSKLYGSDDQSYRLLPAMCYMLEKNNPGAASRAATVEECEEYLSMLDEDDPRIRVYLDKIGVAKWSRCKSPTSRYSSMTSNLAESMNNVNKNARDYSVAKLVEFLRGRMQRWFHERAEIASSTRTPLPKKRENELIQLQRDAFRMKASLVCTYAGIVHPIGDVSGWVIPQEISSRKCDPPSCNKRPPGRPKEKRYPSVGEFRYGKRRVKQRCSRCKSHGHNMKSCTNPIPMADAALT